MRKKLWIRRESILRERSSLGRFIKRILITVRVDVDSTAFIMTSRGDLPSFQFKIKFSALGVRHFVNSICCC